MRIYIVITIVFSIIQLAFAEPVTYGAVTKQTFKNSDCQLTDTCNLEQFQLRVNEYKVFIENVYSYGTALFANFKTKRVSDLEDYVLVQFIKGCQFTSFLDSDNNVKKELNISRRFFGKNIIFQHPNWVIDSIDLDPVYYSNEYDRPRHYFYKWNKKKGSYNKKTQKYYGQKRPNYPLLYVGDHPGVASYLNKAAKNISLQFRMCIYKNSEVPFTTEPNDLTFAKAIKCFDWQSSYIYNFKKKNYQSKKKIDPVCLSN